MLVVFAKFHCYKNTITVKYENNVKTNKQTTKVLYKTRYFIINFVVS